MASGLDALFLISSRGCPFNCSFCGVGKTMGKIHRRLSTTRLIEQISLLKDRYGINGVIFKDSIFNLNREWTKNFCEELIKSNLNINWVCNSRVDSLYEEDLKLMREAGCLQIDLGIESGSQKILDNMRKGIKIDQIRENVEMAKKYMRVCGLFMIGTYGETMQDIKETVHFADELAIDMYGWAIYNPLPGSEWYDKFHKDRPIGEIDYLVAKNSVCAVSATKLNSTFEKICDYFYNNGTYPEFIDTASCKG